MHGFAMVRRATILHDPVTDCFLVFFSDEVFGSSGAKTLNLVFSNQACLVQNSISVKNINLSMLFDPISYRAEIAHTHHRPHF